MGSGAKGGSPAREAEEISAGRRLPAAAEEPLPGEHYLMVST